MVKIGYKIRGIRQRTDLWGIPIPVWDPPVYGYVDEELWAKVKLYMSKIKHKENSTIQENYSTVLARMDLAPLGSSFWHFNIKTPKGHSEIVAFMAENNLVEYTWLDTVFVLPYLKFKAWLYTKQRRMY